MVAPVTPNSASNINGLNSLLRTQQTGNAANATNRNTALAAAKRSDSIAPQLKNITLSSSGAPPSNLPRGSIVDKLV